jgi:hypothetical protein
MNTRLLLVIAALMPWPGAMGAASAQPPQEQVTAQLPRAKESAIDGRVQLLARELDLDATQQVEVRKMLVQQRADTARAWSDESMPSAMRVAATRAIGDRTAERIRAILNDKQREKYLKARPSLSDNAQPATKVESWIDAVGNK